MKEGHADFVQELEEDPEMRKHVAVYWDPEALVDAADRANDMEEDSDAGQAEIEIPLDELLDDLEGLAVQEDTPVQ
jgi:hypothetical protein